MARAYCMFTVKNFTGYDQPLITTYQAKLLGAGTVPRTSLKLVTKGYYKGLDRLECIHEIKDERPHRWADDLPYERDSVVAPKEPYEIYHAPSSDFLIFKGPRRAAKGAFRRLGDSFPQFVSVDEEYVDFGYVLERIRGDVAGGWFTGLPGRVRSAGIFGDNVSLSAQFKEYDPRTISALYVDLVLDGPVPSVQIMITSSRGVVIHEDWSLEQDIDFILGLRPLLCGGNPPKRPRRRTLSQVVGT